MGCKLQYMYLMQYYSVLKNEIMPFANKALEQENVRLNEINQTRNLTVEMILLREAGAKATDEEQR